MVNKNFHKNFKLLQALSTENTPSGRQNTLSKTSQTSKTSQDDVVIDENLLNDNALERMINTITTHDSKIHLPFSILNFIMLSTQELRIISDKYFATNVSQYELDTISNP